MANLFISYDLDAPGQNYQKVIAAIESLGQAMVVHRSLYYVKSSIPVANAEQRVRAAIDRNDRLVVIDANAAQWFNLLPGASPFILDRWNR
jgi:hypothetical protein